MNASATPIIISSVLCVIGLGAEWYYALFYILLPVALTVLYAIVGLIFNVAFPKLEFENEAQPIKQSLAVFLTMLVQTVWCIIIAALTVAPALFGFGALGMILSTLLSVIAAVALWFVLVGPSARRLENL